MSTPTTYARSLRTAQNLVPRNKGLKLATFIAHAPTSYSDPIDDKKNTAHVSAAILIASMLGKVLSHARNDAAWKDLVKNLERVISLSQGDSASEQNRIEELQAETDTLRDEVARLQQQLEDERAPSSDPEDDSEDDSEDGSEDDSEDGSGDESGEAPGDEAGDDHEDGSGLDDDDTQNTGLTDNRDKPAGGASIDVDLWMKGVNYFARVDVPDPRTATEDLQSTFDLLPRSTLFGNSAPLLTKAKAALGEMRQAVASDAALYAMLNGLKDDVIDTLRDNNDDKQKKARDEIDAAIRHMFSTIRKRVSGPGASAGASTSAGASSRGRSATKGASTSASSRSSTKPAAVSSASTSIAEARSLLKAGGKTILNHGDLTNTRDQVNALQTKMARIMALLEQENSSEEKKAAVRSAIKNIETLSKLKSDTFTAKQAGNVRKSVQKVVDVVIG